VALPAEPLVVEESVSVSERSAPNDKLEALVLLSQKAAADPN